MTGWLMLTGHIRKLAVDSMDMHFGVGGVHWLVAIRGKGHAWQVGASLTYSYRGQDGQMEEIGDKKDREEKRMK